MTLTGKVDTRSLAHIERTIGKRPMQRALQAAVRDTTRTARAQVARRIGQDVNLRINTLKKQITTKIGSYNNPKGTLLVTRKAVPLYEYLTAKQRRGSKRGVRVKARKQPSGPYPGGTELHRKAFIATMPSSPHPGVFERVPGTKHRIASGPNEGRLREGLTRKYGPTAVGVFANARGEGGEQTMMVEVRDKMAAQLVKNILSKIDWQLAEWRKRR